MASTKTTAKKQTATVETQPVAEKKDHFLSNALYDVLKVFALVVVPLIGALYFALAGALNLPSPEAVVGALSIGDTALGGLLKLGDFSYASSETKYDGVIQIVETEAKKTYQLILKDDPELIDQMENVLFKVIGKKPSAA